MNNCEDCLYWESKKVAKPSNGETQGVCHLNPPTVTVVVMPQVNQITNQVRPSLVEVAPWPTTFASAWCGGFKQGVLDVKRQSLGIK